MPNPPSSHASPVRVGAVSFLNALPLVEGLDAHPIVSLERSTPSRLAEMLEEGVLDVALVPVIDLLPVHRDWRTVTDACIASDGATLTVRVFSRVDPADITTLHVDRDSHASVALAAILWQEKFDRKLELVPFRVADATPETFADHQAVLLIGDKVMKRPPGLDLFSTQVDLGATWKSLTGLPFVFAVWATPDPAAGERVASVLAAARDDGVARADRIALEHAPQLGWPVNLARSYLTEHLNFTLTARHRAGMRLFLELARRYKVFSPIEPVSA